MKLKLGFMSTKEVSEWFGLTNVKSFKNSMGKKLEILKNFCDFEKVYGGIDVKKIIFEDYSKELYKNIQSGKDQEQFLQDLEKYYSNPKKYSNASMAREWIKNNINGYGKLSERTVAERIRTASEPLAGQINGRSHNAKSEGSHIARRCSIGIVRKDKAGYDELNDKEWEFFNTLCDEYFKGDKNASDKTKMSKGSEILGLTSALARKEISKEEFMFHVEEMSNYFNQVIQKFKEKFGKQLAPCFDWEFVKKENE